MYVHKLERVQIYIQSSIIFLRGFCCAKYISYIPTLNYQPGKVNFEKPVQYVQKWSQTYLAHRNLKSSHLYLIHNENDPTNEILGNNLLEVA